MTHCGIAANATKLYGLHLLWLGVLWRRSLPGGGVKSSSPESTSMSPNAASRSRTLCRLRSVRSQAKRSETTLCD